MDAGVCLPARERAAAGKAYQEAVIISQKIGHITINMMATLGLGMIQEAENQLYVAAETYRRVLDLAGDPPLPAMRSTSGPSPNMREWNDLDAAEQHGRRPSTWPGSSSISTSASEAVAMLAKADHFARQHHFTHQRPILPRHRCLPCGKGCQFSVALAQRFELKLSLARARCHRGYGEGAGHPRTTADGYGG